MKKVCQRIIVSRWIIYQVGHKPDGLIVHAGTNNININKIDWITLKKILNQVKELSPNTKVAFLSIVTRKDKKDMSKTV